MTNTKLYKILSRFDKPKLNRLKKFIHSPYFNTNQQFTNLFDLMYTIVRNAEKKGVPEKEEIWSTLYDKPFSDMRFRRICNELLKLIEKFIGMEYYQDIPLLEWTNQIKAVQQHGYEELYNSIESKLELEFDRSVDQSPEYHLYKYWFEEVKNLRDENNLLTVSNFDELLFQLDSYFFTEKIRQELNITARKFYVNYDYQNNLIDTIQGIIDNHFGSIPVVSIYHKLLLAYQNIDKATQYHQLKSIIEKHILKVPVTHARNIINAIYNLCSKKIRMGKEGYLNEMFEWYQFAIKNNLYLDEAGTIDKTKYKNVISTSLRIGKYEFAENFAYEFANYLDEDNRENILTFNLSQIEFYKGEFENVLSLLSQIKYLDVNDNLNSRMITLSSYYELQEYVAFEYYADSFLSYLNRKKELFNENKRLSYRTFVNMAKKLYKVNAGSLPIERMYEQMEAAKNFPGKSWITKKLDQLDVNKVRYMD